MAFSFTFQKEKISITEKKTNKKKQSGVGSRALVFPEHLSVPLEMITGALISAQPLRHREKRCHKGDFNGPHPSPEKMGWELPALRFLPPKGSLGSINIPLSCTARGAGFLFVLESSFTSGFGAGISEKEMLPWLGLRFGVKLLQKSLLSPAPHTQPCPAGDTQGPSRV